MADISNALRAGNPGRVTVSFNRGGFGNQTHQQKTTNREEYTDGTLSHFKDVLGDILPQGENYRIAKNAVNNQHTITGKAQWHLLTPLQGFESWGNFLTSPRFSNVEVQDYISRIHNKGGVASFDIGVYDNGALRQDYKDRLIAMRDALDGFPIEVPVYVEDDNSEVSYSGIWTTVQHTDDHGGSYKETTANGNYIKYTFTGTGIDVLMRREALANGVTPNTFEVYIDESSTPYSRTDINGNTTTIYTADNGVLMNQVPLVRLRGLTNLAHSIRLVKTAGNKLQLDAFRVIGSVDPPAARGEYINNDNANIVYSTNGNWARYPNRSPQNNYKKDVHASKIEGAYAEYTFTGDGIKFLTEAGPFIGIGYSDVEVTIDGVSQGTFSAIKDQFEAQYVLFEIDGLGESEHTIRVTNRQQSGNAGKWLQVDAFVITHSGDNSEPSVEQFVTQFDVEENTANATPLPFIASSNFLATYSITSGNTGDAFSIDSGSSEMRVNNSLALDYEINPVFNLTILVTGGGTDETLQVTVNLTDVVEYVITAIPDATVAENSIYTGETPVLTGESRVGTVRYTLKGTDKDLFTIDSSTGVVSMVGKDYENPTDADTNNTYDIEITATDSDENTATASWVVTVEDINEEAIFEITAISDATVNENESYTGPTPTFTGGTPIGVLTYTKGGSDSEKFTIDSSTGVVSMEAKDFETPVDVGGDNIYEIEITATDSDENTATASWVVTVEDINEEAIFEITAISDATVNENESYTGPTPTLTGGTPIGVLTYTKGGSDSEKFTIDSLTGVVSMVGKDYENPTDADTNNTYDIEITATDSDENTATASWVVTVEDINEEAIFEITAISDATVNENESYTGPTPTLTLTGGTPIGVLTYTKGGSDSEKFTIDSSTGVVSMVGKDYENPTDADTNNTYDIEITATDSDENTATASWVVTVEDINEEAIFEITAISDATVNENESYTGPTPTLTLTGGTPIGVLTYTKGGSDSEKFTIDSLTGVVSMVGKDYENPTDADTNNTYEIGITATDSDENTATASWVVRVADDLCANTPFGATVNLKGCQIFTLPTSNYLIYTISETCRNSNNGKINISVVDEMNYTATVTGTNGFAVTKTFTDKLEVGNLNAGIYSICFTVDKQSDYNQCFDLVINEPKDLSVSSKIDVSLKRVSLSLKGADVYFVRLNETTYKTSDKKLQLQLKPGINTISVETAILCQGKFEEGIFVSEEIKYFPNPVESELSIYCAGVDTEVEIAVYDSSGKQLYRESKKNRL